MKCATEQMRRINIIVTSSNSYHYFPQPSTGNLAKLSIRFVVQNRPAIPNKQVIFMTVNFRHVSIEMEIDGRV